MKTLLTHPCNEKTAGSGIVCGCIFRALQCVESISGISKDVGNNNVQFTGRRAILGLKILVSKTRFRHKRLLRRAVADLSSCYCRIACFYAKEKKVGWDLDRFGTRALATTSFQTQLSHVQPDPLAKFNRIPRPRFKLGHISTWSVRVHRPRCWPRSWPRSQSFFEVFLRVFWKVFEISQMRLVYDFGTTKKSSKIGF